MPYSKNKTAFVFDDWKGLAESNPEAFEQARQEMIDAMISSVPEKHRERLEGLQWRIDMERKRSSTPLSACVRISSMMLNYVYGKCGLVEALNGDVSIHHQPTADVVSLGDRLQKKSSHK